MGETTCFNPCFSGFTSTTTADATRAASVPACFNPCFSGFTSTTRAIEARMQEHQEVSILVFLDSLLQRLPAGATASGHRVSILVFLDSLLQLCGRVPAAATISLFQSLFFWIHFYNQSTTLTRASFRSGFNPCFSGFTSTTVSRHRLTHIERSSFNPCFSGFTSTTSRISSSQSCQSGFQSLFFWIHFYNAARQATTENGGRHWRFNPCFSGFTSTTPSISPSTPVVCGFQSLFFWIHFYN